MSQTLTSYIPAAGFIAIAVFLIWVGFSRTTRIRARAEAIAAANLEAQLKAVNRNTEALERIATVLEARNQGGPPKSNPATVDSKTGH
jgi:hypothetical protein